MDAIVVRRDQSDVGTPASLGSAAGRMARGCQIDVPLRLATRALDFKPWVGSALLRELARLWVL